MECRAGALRTRTRTYPLLLLDEPFQFLLLGEQLPFQLLTARLEPLRVLPSQEEGHVRPRCTGRDFFPPTLNLLNSREGPAHPLGSSHNIPGLWSPACPGGWRVCTTPAPTTYDMSDDRLSQERQRRLVGGTERGTEQGLSWNLRPQAPVCPLEDGMSFRLGYSVHVGRSHSIL